MKLQMLFLTVGGANRKAEIQSVPKLKLLYWNYIEPSADQNGINSAQTGIMTF